MAVCQTCGDRGWPGALVFCSKCQTIAEHIYCLHQSTETDDGAIRWICEFCETRVIQLSESIDTVSSSEQVKSLEKVQDVKATEQSGTQLNSEEGEYRRTHNTASSTKELEVLHRDCKSKHGNEKQMLNTAEDMQFTGEDCKNIQVGPFHSDSQATSTIPQEDLRDTVQQLPSPIWRGSFCIQGKCCGTINTLQACMSTEASYEASETARSLSVLLCLEMVPKTSIWPLRYKDMEPTAENIAVYFFPEDYRAEREYDSLVDDMIEHELAMITRVHDVELLVFSSRELHEDYWRFQRKYYLWGIFRRKKKQIQT